MRDDLPDVEAIRASITVSQLIGSGGNAHVYDIVDHPKYVLKIQRYPEFNIGNTVIDKPQSISFSAPDNVEDERIKHKNFGQAVAAYWDGEVEILLKQHGIVCGIPRHHRRCGVVPLPQDQLDQMFWDSLERVTNMPQSAYANLLEDIKLLNANGYTVDTTNMGNILVDKSANAFRILDIGNIGHIPVRYPPSGDDILGMLTGAKVNCPGLVRYQDGFSQYYDAIFEKVLTACEQTRTLFYPLHPENNANSRLASTKAGSKERYDIVRRIQKLHGSNVDMPTKNAPSVSSLVLRWAELHPEIYSAGEPITYQMPNGVIATLDF